MSAILIVEDEKHLADGLRFNLEAEGYDVTVAATGEQALVLMISEGIRFDVVVLDVMLPGKDGFAVASELRRVHCFAPILMLTARGRSEDVLLGFEAGADDYLPKPFELDILLARIKGLMRRSEWTRQTPVRDTESSAKDRIYKVNGRTVDFVELHLQAAGQAPAHLTLMEANLLRYLIDHEGQVVSRKALLEDVWGLHEDTDTRAIDNFIVRLRRYIEDEPSQPRHLITVRSVGYRFVGDANSGDSGS